jgi:hypothetical protein
VGRDLRCQGRLTSKEARHYRRVLKEQSPAESKNVVAFFERLDMSEWLEVRSSLDCEVRIESMEPGDHGQPLNWATTGLSEGGPDQPEIFLKWVDPKQRLWDSPNF